MTKYRIAIHLYFYFYFLEEHERIEQRFSVRGPPDEKRYIVRDHFLHSAVDYETVQQKKTYAM